MWDPSNEMKLSVPRDLTSNAFTNLEAEHIHAFRTGSALDLMILAERHRARLGKFQVVYADRILTWIDAKSPGSARVVCLPKEAHPMTVASNFAHLSYVAVSKSMLCL